MDPVAAGERPPTEVVEALGFGRAQLIAFVVAGLGVQFCDGMTIALTNDLAKSMGEDFKLGDQERALLATALFTGVFIGTCGIGNFGDNLGRRPTLLAAEVILAAALFVGAIAQSYYLVLLAFALAGLGAGASMPLSVALLSEVCPSRYRLMVRTAANICGTLGNIFTVLLLASDSQQLTHLHWRIQITILALAPSVTSLLAYCFLQESPIFLAATGQHANALQVFEHMRRLNAAAGVEIAYSVGGDEEPGSVLSILGKLQMIFSERRMSTTISLGFAMFCASLSREGYMYALPLILQNIGSSGVSTTDQLLYNGIVLALGMFVACLLAERASRAGALLASLLGSAGLVLLFGVAGSQPRPRSALVDALFQVGSTCNLPATQFVMVVGFQIAAEAYPASVASTSSSLVQGMGRFGALIASQVYELLTSSTGEWTTFFYIVASLTLCAALSVLLCLRIPSQDVLQGKGGSKQSVNYGAIGDSKA